MARRGLELLSPAKDLDTARQAILHGADAVYIGGPSHGARAAAANSIQDIAELTGFAHQFGVKIYVTLNTLIYDNELKQVEKNIHQLYDAGIDALIVQDMGILRMDIPPIDLHASTQCDIRTPEKAKFLAQCGFSQLVLPRELSLDEISAIRKAVPDHVVLEAFVHGALCVSYSGDCQASLVAKGRSANRGECAQMCRLPYDLTDSEGNILIKDKHFLSLKDLNRLQDLNQLIDAGISSFKIEGRLKDAAYVKNTVAAYRQRLDNIITQHPDEFCRTSHGEIIRSFQPDVNKVFNRGFTSYFINGKPQQKATMTNLLTPKWVGEEVGEVIKMQGNAIKVKLKKQLNNADGLGYFSSTGEYQGFHLNRIDGDLLLPASKVDIAPGTVLYRNRDIKFDQQMAQNTSQRLLPIDIRLTENEKTISIEAKIQDGPAVTEIAELEVQEARTPQRDTRLKALSKLGGTIFKPRQINDEISDTRFIPLSTLTALRQQAIANLSQQILTDYKRKPRLPEDKDAKYPQHNPLTYHDNVANDLAQQFYLSHGAEIAERALEVSPQSPDKAVRVMTTRYCIRRELGACLMTKDASKLPTPLFIKNNSAKYELRFDCKNCQMQLYANR